jgi:hypothetical protein
LTAIVLPRGLGLLTFRRAVFFFLFADFFFTAFLLCVQLVPGSPRQLAATEVYPHLQGMPSHFLTGPSVIIKAAGRTTRGRF